MRYVRPPHCHRFGQERTYRREIGGHLFVNGYTSLSPSPRGAEPWRSWCGAARGRDLALSWSGETRELSDVIGYTKRHAVRLIAIKGTAESASGRAADAALVLPKVKKACPQNLAPTTPSLLQLALGDALAIALLQMRGFSEESFHSFHPAGSLGGGLEMRG
ncbi:MAG: SIS domain-containing protein [Boseongicola sp.]|nr:SIS domain-containing protein [Boseongicola sp.]